jgi:type IV secretory pathway TrbD component
MQKTPRIERVAVRGPTTLRIKWRGGPTDDIDLAGWIATGRDILARLSNRDVFAKARIVDHGAAVAWDEDDQRIDAVHLEQLATEQRPFRAKEAAEWQRGMRLSNHEAAALLGIAVSTWNAYKAQGKIPIAVAMLCRAARRDPIMMHAYFRPSRAAGRPRKSA